MQHAWKLIDGKIDSRRPIYCKFKCQHCPTLLWLVCGVEVYHPEGIDGGVPDCSTHSELPESDKP